MKKFAKLSVFALTALCAVAFTGCGTSTITSTPNQGVEQGVAESVGDYSKIAYFETDNPSDVKISIDTDDIQKVSFKYRTLGDKEYSFKNGTLTIKKSVFADETAGDKRLRVFVGDKFFEIKVRVVTKVICTADDFNAIRNNMNGTYVLGNDIDFGGAEFFPLGKSLSADESTTVFEGIFDGMGYAVKNVSISAYDNGEGENNYYDNGTLVEIQGPSLGNKEENGRNYNNGLFMTTGGSAEIINTRFLNITVDGQGLNGAVVGSNGGLIKNCFVTSTLYTHAGYTERAGGIVGTNGSSDAVGRIENCLCIYSWSGTLPARGIADWNSGIIRNCYAALRDDYVYHMGYDAQTGRVKEDFDYDEFITQENFNTYGLGWHSTPAFPGALSWVDGNLIYYKGGDIINSDVVRKEYLCNPDNFREEDGWDRSVWSFVYGGYPTLKIQTR